jgi:regulator of sigma E protease
MSVILTIFGIGLLLVIHEGGHYFAARAVGIRVKVFAIGFGPRLFGWQRNGTDFRVSLLPLGGYVQVSGDDPSRPPRPGDLFYASAKQRLLFYAGGIMANFLFAFLIIPVLFFVGVPFVSPTVGAVSPDSPAWNAGMLPDDVVLSINEREVHGFRHISSGIALAERDTSLDIVVMRDGERINLNLQPQFDEEKGFSTIGIAPAYDLSLAPDSDISQAMGEYSQLVAINGLEISNALGSQLALLSLGDGRSDFVLSGLNADNQRRDFTFQSSDYVNLTLAAPAQLGVTVLAQQVSVARGMLSDILAAGDKIVAINDHPLSKQSDLLEAISITGSETLTLSVVDTQNNLRQVRVPPTTAHQLLQDLALVPNDDMAFYVHPQSAAFAAGLRTGCSILRANDVAIQKMSDLRSVIGSNTEGQSINFIVLQNDSDEPTEIGVTPAAIPQLDLGLMLMMKPTTVVARQPLHAISLGFREAKAMVSEVATTAKRLFTGEVASKNMGGIISIGVMTNSFASQGLVSLFFFLCLISVNLGVLNFIPIPALDGGHILFALYEIVSGRKVSVAVQNIFQIIGVVLVLSLLVFVTSNDIQRLLQ